MRIVLLVVSLSIISYLMYPFIANAGYTAKAHVWAPVVVPFFVFIVPFVMHGNEELAVVETHAFLTAAIFIVGVVVLYVFMLAIVNKRFEKSVERL